MSTAVKRPKRWDAPLTRDLSDAELTRVLGMPPFSNLDEASFSGPFSLRDIIRNDARILGTNPGDIIVRQGDWGSSAFFILSGSVRVEIEPPGSNLPPSVLGRTEVHRKGFFSALAQFFTNRPEPEFRDRSKWGQPDAVGARGEGDQTRIYLQDVPGILDHYQTVKLGAGEVFGELAALGRTARTSTVFVDEPGEILEIRWQGLRDIIRKDRDGRLRAEIDRRFRERGLQTFLQACPLFRKATEAQLELLVKEALFSTFGSFDSPKPFRVLAQEGVQSSLRKEPVVAEEGDYPNGIVLVRSGFARLSQKHHHGHRTFGYLTPGQVFGFQEIEEGFDRGEPIPLRNSLRAIGFLTAIMIPTHVVEEVVLGGDGQSTGEARTRRRVEASESAKKTNVSSVIDQSFVEFLVGRKYVQGSATMAIDLDRCTRCDDCVRACASGHDGNPRFVRHGPKHDHYMIATACMHCSDPVCMIECPTGAIHRNIEEGSVVVNPRTCIGCSACANNCPYDAIRMVATRDANGFLHRDESTGLPLVQATKCDLCVEQMGGPACERACPHDALVRLDMRDLASIEGVVTR